MEIKLEHSEIIIMQNVRAERHPGGGTDLLICAGLVKPDLSGLTDLGEDVLKKHLPVGTTRNYSLEHHQCNNAKYRLK